MALDNQQSSLQKLAARTEEIEKQGGDDQGDDPKDIYINPETGLQVEPEKPTDDPEFNNQGDDEGSEGDNDQKDKQGDDPNDQQQQDTTSSEDTDSDDGNDVADTTDTDGDTTGYNDKNKDRKVDQDPDLVKPLADLLDPTSTTKPSRDYTGFDEEDKNFLKKLPNDLFAKYSTRIKQREEEFKQQLEQAKTSQPTFTEHLEGYRLLPRYKELSDTAAQSSELEAHYLNQLTRIKQGQSWQHIAGIDDKGNVTYTTIPGKTQKDSEGNEVPILDSVSEVKVQQILNKLSAESSSINREIDQIRQGHKQSVETTISQIDNLRSRLFANINLDSAPYKEAKNAIGSFFSDTLRQHPSTQLFMDGYAVATQLAARVRQLDAQVKQLQKTQKDKKLAGPNSRNVGASDKTKTEPTLKASDWGL